MVHLVTFRLRPLVRTVSDKFSFHSSLYQNNYTKEENQKFTVAFGELTQRFASAMSSGLESSDDQVQELVKQHYEFCLQFWTPNKDAYKQLALSYILPSPYRDAYENVAEGLGKYHYEALCVWADKNLAD